MLKDCAGLSDLASFIPMPQDDLSLEIHPWGPGEPLRLSGHANAYQAAELHTLLCRYVSETDHPVIDLSGLASCDTLSLQLLFAAGGRAALAGTMPPCLVERCGALGLPLPLGGALLNAGNDAAL